MKSTVAIIGDATAVEQLLHKAFPSRRVHPRRAALENAPEQSKVILQLTNALDITEEVRAEVTAKRTLAEKRSRDRRRRPRFAFNELDIAPGALLVYEHDADVQAEVVDERQVRLASIPEGAYGDLRANDDLWHLSPLTAHLLSLDHNVAPTRYWRTEDGRLLSDIYNQMHAPAT